MLQIKPFQKYTEEYEQWFEAHPMAYESELSAVKMQLLKVGENVSGIEVGLGSARFAAPLGIKEGLEPASRLRDIARKKGVETIGGRAEKLPYRDLHFDFVLFVTIEHLDDLAAALKEAHRVLKHKGSVILGFIEKDSLIGQAYQQRRRFSHFYEHATFYTVERVKKLLNAAGFTSLDFIQTLFGELDDIDERQSPKDGYGEGSFIVVKADKK
ncbi:MAG: class I SAM-dependent methyltransferase [Saprospiraceae bacterium]|nr:class I SAM-dependent methyltransferase [Saprospiraceae bacterium]MCF8250499.1 class I SAM-dependent methyltransferase [Saprospiraceae bacterium]MCF8279639.1 class I SAM-dependent methyltransferase [Bacteroidales bacterium]MCF8312425.1 class I SAM-dependent methyltransferase [Saprospiraceae bacterium]MCF8440758.1 class I SAM-dependent methyltransferase [Saprospiraceae bacterium]